VVYVATLKSIDYNVAMTFILNNGQTKWPISPSHLVILFKRSWNDVLVIVSKLSKSGYLHPAPESQTSQWRRAVENRCVFSARLKALSDRSGDCSAGGRRFHMAGPLTAKLRCPVAARARGTSRVPVAADRCS